MERSLVREIGSRDTLSLERVVESQVRTEDDHPSNQTGNGGKIIQPVEHFGTSPVGNGHEPKKTKEGSDRQSPNRKTGLGTFPDECWSFSFQRQGVKSTRRGVKIRVSGRPGRNKNNSVDDRRKSLDTGVVDGNDERRRSGGSGSTQESWVVIGNQDRDDPDTENVEEDDSNENGFDGSKKEVEISQCSVASVEISLRTHRGTVFLFIKGLLSVKANYKQNHHST